MVDVSNKLINGQLDDLAITTTAQSLLSKLSRWSQSQSIWPFPVGGGCCSLEYSAALSPKFNLVQEGVGLDQYTPAESDVLIVTGVITEQSLPSIKKIYEKMPSPKWVMSLGACSSSGGLFQSYNTIKGIGTEIPVDVFVPGCPPAPEAIVSAFSLLKERIEKGVSASEPH
jgi:NADH-quinone oxidoreductase subunit B